MKPQKAKPRPDWCKLRLLGKEELHLYVDTPLWLEFKRFGHLNCWCLAEWRETLGAVALITCKGWYDTSTAYGEDFVAYSPMPFAPSPEHTGTVPAIQCEGVEEKGKQEG